MSRSQEEEEEEGGSVCVGAVDFIQHVAFTGLYCLLMALIDAIMVTEYTDPNKEAEVDPLYPRDMV